MDGFDSIVGMFERSALEGVTALAFTWSDILLLKLVADLKHVRAQDMRGKLNSVDPPASLVKFAPRIILAWHNIDICRKHNHTYAAYRYCSLLRILKATGRARTVHERLDHGQRNIYTLIESRNKKENLQWKLDWI
jgi:hypothetical protein